MKRNLKIFIIMILALALLAGCQKGKASSEVPKENTSKASEAKADNQKNEEGEDSKKTSSKGQEDLKPVKGAIIGSMSSYVEDREIWNDFIDEKSKGSAKRDEFGLHLPRILLDSKDAEKANQEIDEIADNLRKIYQSGKGKMEEDETGIYSSFSVYQDDHVLSLMIEIYDTLYDDPPGYFAYNFSLPDGKFIDDYELMKNFGVEKDEILGIIEDSLREEQDWTTMNYNNDVLDYTFIYNQNNSTGLIFKEVWDNFESNENKIYIDEVGKAHFLLSQYPIVNMVPCPVTLELKADRFNRDPISAEYLKMARKLGIDPKDKNHKAFIIHLGAAFDEESLAATLEKLSAWTTIFLNFDDPNMLVSMKQSEGGDMPYLNGEECYLVIPKYRNASVSLKELEISQDGKLKEVANELLDFNACAGTTFVCQNISDIAPNGKITIRYRDDVIEFSPSISLKDGSLMLPEGVTDAEDILDWKSLAQENIYSPRMFEIMKSIIGKG
ncbi:MAG: hypothetical protein E6249_07370 [Peptoniphilus grossensis]|uniref:hypothetical protein n=1 Tax=Peptoniphilus grossensis TaxID=1465756 RepID=UPI002586031F|nr:hypothetical protein [Peptoniphilus grossensis]MDU5100275.1 hypothetical protein [Peptoniphilus grossensis]